MRLRIIGLGIMLAKENECTIVLLIYIVTNTFELVEIPLFNEESIVD